jgi:hypothetical protein
MILPGSIPAAHEAQYKIAERRRFADWSAWQLRHHRGTAIVPTFIDRGAAVLAFVAMGVAGLALTINAQYGAAIGETVLTSWTFMGVAVAVDLLAVTLAPATVVLWRTKQRGLAIATWAIWGAVIVFAILGTLGYLQKNLASATLILATATADQRAAILATAHFAVETARTARENECAVRDSRCLKREPDERSAVSAPAATVSSRVVAPVRISGPDPQLAAATRLARCVGLGLTADNFSNIRLGLWAVILDRGRLTACGRVRPNALEWERDLGGRGALFDPTQRGASERSAMLS